MPKVGMEPIRRGALVQATIHEIGRAGSLDVTVTQIARRAGVSSALAHHYFGGKEQIFLAAMRHILSVYGAQVRAALFGATSPRDRVEAIIRANFEAGNFRPEVIAAWLNFYVMSQSNDGARRLLRVYQHRLHSNLVHALSPLVGDDAHDLADTLASMIDGLYIRHALREDTPSGARACDRVLKCLDTMLESDT
ncbi:HTH-type transcriptional regulator BetI [Aliiroseovarius zhejiangensis]|uniref:HTH-type transcriptional regulator BetI n=1 Tax=Aliiroseovarius zhejiangensis TaxID=1632025 RepID=A0ABQ3IRJ6_9RHOB|nr:transcriptional regulator BetI [Aliiroseovarius zhejiangensis]GHE90250.1 HTH-type transcriptional regulator BetI [Aliiroseovarius zhejiangensis]